MQVLEQVGQYSQEEFEVIATQHDLPDKLRVLEQLCLQNSSRSVIRRTQRICAVQFKAIAAGHSCIAACCHHSASIRYPDTLNTPRAHHAGIQ